jgi:hypothetical protein
MQQCTALQCVGMQVSVLYSQKLALVLAAKGNVIQVDGSEPTAKPLEHTSPFLLGHGACRACVFC